ncbi:MAG: hypothetical protein JJU00_13155 [Opitutales bacterium]|nr:hypothetical protein [Opitutales bacterium]
MPIATQLDIPLLEMEEPDAVHYWAESAAETRGEVFTKPEVAGFILDLVDWRVGQSLLSKRLLEPLLRFDRQMRAELDFTVSGKARKQPGKLDIPLEVRLFFL